MSRRQGHRPRLGVVSTLTDINLASRAVVSNRPDKRCRGRPTGSACVSAFENESRTSVHFVGKFGQTSNLAARGTA